jgi:ribosomal protein S9
MTKDLTDEQLKAVLITCDGLGKTAKAEALDELIARAVSDYEDRMYELSQRRCS